MIPLRLPAEIEAKNAFVTRVIAGVGDGADISDDFESRLVFADTGGVALAGHHGMLSVDGVAANDLVGDVLLVDPARGMVERLFRKDSQHNTLLVTERCDQLCQMCSQPPKKTHDDRFSLLKEACLLAPQNAVVGITGGEPTLYKDQLLDLIEAALEARPDLAFHVLSNGQHFTQDDADRLRSRLYDRVVWGIPLYSSIAGEHDAIVAKPGAFARLHESFGLLLRAGARLELRTVVLTSNAPSLAALGRHVAYRLGNIESWSIMQLESIGYARNRWRQLLFDHARDFAPISAALDIACLHGLRANLFNFPLCTVPEMYRGFAVRSISDWKQKYVGACAPCTRRTDCCGFFEWHPEEDAMAWTRPL